MSQRRSALGRGLGALISSPPPPKQTAPASSSGRPDIDETQYGVDTIKGREESNSAPTGPQELDIELIDPNPEQPRREFESVALEQLARSIGQHGVLQPVVVRQAGSRFELVMGERRFRASQLAGRKTLPAVILDVDPADRLELAIVENVQREDLNLAMDRSSVSNHIRLLDLSRGIQTDIENGRLSMGHAKALLQVADVELRESLRAKILRESLSVRASERAARDLGGGTRRTVKQPKPKAPTSVLDPDTRAYVERIERRLQTKVTLQANSDGSGKLEINYFNLEDLERLGNLLLGESA